MKIIISTGFGAGWSTWHHEKQHEIATFQPIIDFLEAGGNANELQHEGNRLVAQMEEDLGLEKGTFFTGGARDGLRVVEIPDGVRYRINEYDGSESPETDDQDIWWN